MTSVSTVFFCHVAGKKILSPEGKVIGRLKDLIADPAFARPEIIAAVVSCPDGQKILDFSAFDITNGNGRTVILCKEIRPVDLSGMETIHVASQLLNKKVIDMDRKKTILVYDVMIAIQNHKTTIAAVDAGTQGRLRQLGVSQFAQKFMKLFDLSIPNQLILWNNVEVLRYGKAGDGLSKTVSALNRLHPSEMADIIEGMDHNTQMELFSAMDMERAADVLEELEPGTQDSLLEGLPSGQIADVLEIMPADEVADILDEVDKKKAEELLREMDSDVSGEVRELMEYEGSEIGSLMTTDFYSFHDADSVEAALDVFRREKPDYDMIYYVYVVSEKGELEATLSLRDIIVAGPGTALSEIMNRDVIYVYDTDRIGSLNEIISKYNLLAVPVVDASMILLGTVIINDVLFSLLRSRN